MFSYRKIFTLLSVKWIGQNVELFNKLDGMKLFNSRQSFFIRRNLIFYFIPELTKITLS